MGLLGLYMGKVTQVWKKMVGSAFFLKLVRPLVFSDPASAENRVAKHPLWPNFRDSDSRVLNSSLLEHVYILISKYR